MLRQPGMEQALHAWRNQPRPPHVRAEPWHGDAWNWLDASSRPFADNLLGIQVTIGLDWFCPFKFHRTASYTTGALLVQTNNLPPSMRTQQRYIHIAGLLPGKQNNTILPQYLKLLIAKLEELETHSALICTHDYPRGRQVKVQVLSFVGNFPACTKVGGHPGATSTGQMCRFCMCKLSQAPEVALGTYTAPPRDPEVHRHDSMAANEAVERGATASTIKAMCKRTGAHPSALYGLSSWQSMTSIPVGVMHEY